MKNCTDKTIGIHLHAYEISALDANMTEEFENHILKCDYCFEKLKEFEDEALILKDGNQLLDTIQNPKQSLNKLTLINVVLATMVVLMIYPAFIGLTSTNSSSIRTVDSIMLVPVRSADNSFGLNTGSDIVLSFVYPDSDPKKEYSIEIFSGEDVIYTHPSFSDFDSYNTGHILIPHRFLSSGNYQCLIKDNDSNNDKILLQYNFKII